MRTRLAVPGRTRLIALCALAVPILPSTVHAQLPHWWRVEVGTAVTGGEFDLGCGPASVELFSNWPQRKAWELLGIRLTASDKPGLLAALEELSFCGLEEEAGDDPRATVWVAEGRVLHVRYSWAAEHGYRPPSPDSLMSVLKAALGQPNEETDAVAVWYRDSLRILVEPHPYSEGVGRVFVSHHARCPWLYRHLGGGPTAAWRESCWSSGRR